MRAMLSPIARCRKLAGQLRRLRTERGLTEEQVAERLVCSPSKLSRMETGHGIATTRDLRDLYDLYEVTDDAERQRMIQLSYERKRQRWWQGYDLHSFTTYVGLETEAVGIKYCRSSNVPGLLQTPDYARAMHAVGVSKIALERIDQLIDVRLKRQRRFGQDPPMRLEVVLDEAVLHRLVGGRSVIGTQLGLIELSKQPNVTMQVIPFNASAHPAMDSTFNILEFAAPCPVRCMLRGP